MKMTITIPESELLTIVIALWTAGDHAESQGYTATAKEYRMLAQSYRSHLPSLLKEPSNAPRYSDSA